MVDCPSTTKSVRTSNSRTPKSRHSAMRSVPVSGSSRTGAGVPSGLSAEATPAKANRTTAVAANVSTFIWNSWLDRYLEATTALRAAGSSDARHATGEPPATSAAEPSPLRALTRRHARPPVARKHTASGRRLGKPQLGSWIFGKSPTPCRKLYLILPPLLPGFQFLLCSPAESRREGDRGSCISFVLHH